MSLSFLNSYSAFRWQIAAVYLHVCTNVFVLLYKQHKRHGLVRQTLHINVNVTLSVIVNMLKLSQRRFCCSILGGFPLSTVPYT